MTPLEVTSIVLKKKKKKVKSMKSLSRVRLFATSWTVAHQAPRSMGFSRHEYWSVAVCFSRGSSQPRDRTPVSCIVGRCFTIWATRDKKAANAVQCFMSWHRLEIFFWGLDVCFWKNKSTMLSLYPIIMIRKLKYKVLGKILHKEFIQNTQRKSAQIF